MGWERGHAERHRCGCYTVTVSHDFFPGSHEERYYCKECGERMAEMRERQMQEQREEQERRDNALHQCCKCKLEASAIDMGYTKRGSVYKKCVECRGPPRPRKTLRKRR